MSQDDLKIPDEPDYNEPSPTTGSAKPGFSDDPPKEADSRYSSQDEEEGKDYDTSQGERE